MGIWITLLAFVAWIVFSTLMDGRERNKARIRAEMKDLYSKDEVVDLLYSMKREVMVLYLAYGGVIGGLFAIIITRRV